MKIDETKLKADIIAFFREKGYEIDQISFNEKTLGPIIQNGIHVIAIINQPHPDIQKKLEEAGVTK